jgi:hypothetical protein
MKKVVLICVLILGVISAFAQTPVPNFGFESWNLHNGRLVPDSWLVRDTTASRTTDKYAGNYAVRIQNILLPSDTSKGTLVSLQPDSSEGMNPAFPIFVRHTTLNGYYKYTPVNGDSAQIMLFIYKYGFINPPSYNLLGGSWASKGASNTYVPFVLYILYFDSTLMLTPDSACIAFSAYKQINFTTGTELYPLGNSVLFVDNVSFDGFISGINNIPNLVKEVNVYPNPASSTLNIDMNLGESDYYVNLYDLNGRLIKTIANGNLSGQQQLSVNIEDVPSGDYLLMISNKDGYCNKKVSIIR